VSYTQTASGIFVLPDNLRYQLGRDVPGDVARALGPILSDFHKGFGAARTTELEELAILMDGGEGALNNRFFPKPDGYDPRDWEDIRSRLMVLVNLVQTTVRKMRSRVYGGHQHRDLVKNPHKAEVSRALGKWYQVDMLDWFTNRIAFSNAPCVVLGKRTKTGKIVLRRWFPDPVHTYLAQDGDDFRRYSAVAEFSADGGSMQFVTAKAEGFIQRGQTPVVVDRGEDIPQRGGYIYLRDMGFLPAVVAHATMRRNRQCPYSVPGVRDAKRFTVRATDTLFNGSLLQKVQTKGLLAINGTVDQQTMDFAEMIRQGVIYLDAEGKVQWITPGTNIGDTIMLLDKLIDCYSVVAAMPLDNLNPTSAKGMSAEAADRLEQPNKSLTGELATVATLDEEELVLIKTAVVRWMNTGKPVDLDELEEEVETDISLHPPLKPLTSQEDAQISQIGHDLGTILDEDNARAWNLDANDKKLKRVVENMATKAKAAAIEPSAPGGNAEEKQKKSSKKTAKIAQEKSNEAS